MSYGIMAFAVSIDKVNSLLGQRNRKRGWFARLFGRSTGSLVKTLKRKFVYRFEEDEGELEEEDAEQTQTLEQALVDLLDGNELHSSFGQKYGFAFELLCHHLGESLNSSAWESMRISWAEQVQQGMIQVGIDENAISLTNHLMFRGPPIHIPPPDDFPSIGFLRIEEMETAAIAIDGADLSQVDEEVEESVMQIRSWLARCKELNRDLICFYY